MTSSYISSDRPFATARLGSFYPFSRHLLTARLPVSCLWALWGIFLPFYRPGSREVNRVVRDHPAGNEET